MNAVDALAALRARPRPTGARGPRPRDVALVAALAAVAAAEGALRTDLEWAWATTLVTVAMLPLLLWRRLHPLPVVAAMTAATTAFSFAQGLSGIDPDALVVTVAFLAVPYAVFRWGSGRDQVVGAVVIAAGVVATSWPARDTIADLVAGIVFMGGACLIGELRRERVEARARQLDAIRAREREALARDLHDTVAHHVSVIVIRAQVAAADTGDTARVAESLGVIEREAQAVLADMRSLVRALRAPADYAPSPGLDELARLADAGPPPVRVRIDAPADLPGIVASTLFRIAQEGVTNARRHSSGATRVDVAVVSEDGTVRLTVRDDGAPARPASGEGLGLPGMAERAALLGGEVVAGPDPDGGWTLRAALPVVAEHVEADSKPKGRR